MNDIVTPLLQWLNANPEWAGFATFLISAAESVAIIGTIVPGSITMTAIGALAGAGIIPLWPTLIWATIGAIGGDGISYWFGHYFKDRLRSIWPFRQHPEFLEKGEVFVHKYGVMSVFIGRFVGPVRALVPLVAGMLGMKPLQFTIANVTSAIGWAPVYMLPGILLGAVSLELPPDIALHVMLVLVLLTLFILLCLWFIYKLLKLASNQIEQTLVAIWMRLSKSHYFHFATVILKHYDPKQLHGQLTLAFYFILTSLLFVGLVTYVTAVGPANITINNVLYHLFRGIRTDGMDNIMLAITLLGQKQIILPVIFVLTTWFLFTQRMRAALHTLALGLFAAVSAFILKSIIQSPRPWGIFHNSDGFSMPSGHVTLATTIYMGIAFMIATPMSPQKRWMIYLPAAIVAFAVGISRMYLGAHWFTDVLGGWLLSTAILMIVILSFHRQSEKVISLRGISLVCSLTLFISYTFFAYSHFSVLKTNYTQLNFPTAAISVNTWWTKEETNEPIDRVSLFGLPSQIINVQWAGDLEKIRQTLQEDDWSKPPSRDWISTLHRIADIKSTEYLPLVSPQYLDKKPVLILAKRMEGSKKLVVLRLWESDRIIQETQTPLWVGTVGTTPRSYGWLSRKRRMINSDPDFIFSSTKFTQQWQWKLITVKVPNQRQKNGEQEILLVRSK